MMVRPLSLEQRHLEEFPSSDYLNGRILVPISRSTPIPTPGPVWTAAPPETSSWLPEPEVNSTLQDLERRLEKRLHERGILLPTLVQFAEELRQMPYLESTLKLAGCAIFSLSLGLSAMTLIAGVRLIQTTGSGVWTSGVADEDTNGACILSMFTDFPALLCLFVMAVFDNAHGMAEHNCIAAVFDELAMQIPPEAREALYEHKVELLGRWEGLSRYFSPDPQSEQGRLHAALGPMLKEIDQEIKKDLALTRIAPAIGKRVIANWGKLPLKQRTKEIAWFVGKGSFGLSAQGFASWLIVACIKIISDTEYSQFFSEDPEEANNETNYFTNVGALWPSIITWLFAIYFFFYLGPIRDAHIQVLKEILYKCFGAHPIPGGLNNDAARSELKKIYKVTSRYLTGS